MTKCAALIVAAGRGERFGGDLPKQYLPLAGRPVLGRTVAAFLGHPAIDRVIVVIQPDHRALYDAAVAELADPRGALAAPVAGGADRQGSVQAGLEALAAEAPGLVLIHDAARPLVDAATIDRVIAALAEVPAAIAAIRITDTLKRSADAGQPTVAGTVPRDGLWAAQTPQGFRFPDILAAHRRFAGAGLTDDSAIAEQAGLPVRLVEGHPDNLKVTTPIDLARAALIATPALPDIRVGHGFDVHAFAPPTLTRDDAVILCGVRVPHERKLEGHSDADVGLHALTDAILGAISAGDIGSHFPPSDPQWRGADSAAFLAHAAGLVAARGGIIAHADITLICERPKIGPHREAMVARVAEILGIAADRVSVKATTTERLGFTGRGEGIAAQATATVRLP